MINLIKVSILVMMFFILSHHLLCQNSHIYLQMRYKHSFQHVYWKKEEKTATYNWIKWLHWFWISSTGYKWIHCLCVTEHLIERLISRILYVSVIRYSKVKPHENETIIGRFAALVLHPRENLHIKKKRVDFVIWKRSTCMLLWLKPGKLCQS